MEKTYNPMYIYEVIGKTGGFSPQPPRHDTYDKTILQLIQLLI